MRFSGTWHIYEMEVWDEDYFNMEVQAYIKIRPDGLGEDTNERFEFNWEGSDEHHPASGSGWVRLGDKDHMEGWIKLHLGDSSEFLARRAE